MPQMPSNNWPFKIRQLTEVAPPNVLTRLLGGVSVALGRATQLGELVDGDIKFIEVHDQYKFFSPLCLYVRDEIPGGRDLCAACDKEKGFSAFKSETEMCYECKVLGLTEFLYPIKVAGLMVGVMYTGQIAVDTDWGYIVDKILSMQTKSGTIKKDHINNLLKLLNKEKTLDLYETNKEKAKFYKEAEDFTKILNTFYAHEKITKEAEFLSQLMVSLDGANIEQFDDLWELINKNLKHICDFMQLDYAIFMTHNSPEELNFLHPVASFGYSKKKLNIMHFDWTQSDLPDGTGHLLSRATLNLKKAIVGSDEAFCKSLSCVIASRLSNGYKGLLFLGAKNPFDIDVEKNFLANLARSFVSSLIVELENLYLTQMKNAEKKLTSEISHHIFSSLNPVTTTIARIQRYSERQFISDKYVPLKCKDVLNNLGVAVRLAKQALKHGTEERSIEYSWGTFSLVELISESVREYSDAATEKGIDIIPHIDVRLPPKIRCDRDRLKMVILCILNNAIKYAHAGPGRTIDIYLKQVDTDKGMYFDISIEDFGLGILSEDAKHIFSYAYTAARRGMARKEPRHGIGLSWVWDVLKLHGGTISFESVRHKSTIKSTVEEGYKTTFTVRLPQWWL